VIRRFLAAAGITACVLALLVAMAALWLGSDTGRAWLAAQLLHATDGALTIEALSGHPLHRLAAASIEFHNEGLDVRVEDLDIAWRLWDLFAGQIHIRSITANHVRIQQFQGDQALSPPPALPLGLISRLRLDAVHIGTIDLIDPAGQPGPRLRDARLAQLGFTPEFSGVAELVADEQKLEMRLAGEPDKWSLTATIIPVQAAHPAIAATLHGRRLDVGDVVMTISTTEGKLDLDGQWTYADDAIQAQGGLGASFPPIDVKAEWTGSSDIRFSRLRFSLDATFDGGAMLGRLLHVTADAVRDDAGLQGSLQEDEGLQANWRLDQNGRFQVEASLRQWSVPLAMAEGRLTGEINASIDPASLDWTVKAGIHEGEMAGMVARLAIDGTGQAGVWRLSKGTADMLGVNIEAHGSGDTEHAKLDGRIESRNIATLLALAGVEGAQGSLSASFGLSGRIDDPRLEWRAQLRQFDGLGLRLNQLKTKGWIMPGPRHGEVSMHASVIDYETWHWDETRLGGRLDEQGLYLKTNGKGDMAWKVDLSGQPQDGHGWAGRLARLVIAHDGREIVVMRDRDWRWQEDRLELPEGKLALAGQPGEFGLSITEGGMQGNLAMDDFQAHAVKPWLPPRLSGIEGRLWLRLALSGSWQAPALAIEAKTDDLHVLLPSEAGDVPPLDISAMQWKADYLDERFTWNTRGTADGAGTFQSNGTIPWQWSLKPWTFMAAVDGESQARLALRIDQLEAIKSLLPRLDPLDGSVAVDIDVVDPLGRMHSSGSARVTLDAAGVPEFGLDMRGELKADWRGNQGDLAIEASAGEGRLTMAGPMAWPVTHMPTLSLNKFPLIQLPEQNVTVDGDLNMSQQDGIAWLKGELTASPLRIEIPEMLPTATDDLVWKDSGEEQAEAPMARTRLDIALNLGEQAEVYGRGMRLTLAGQLHLGGSVSQPWITGELRIPGGGIDFRNIHLDVSPSSRVIFTGEIERPLIDIEAVRKIDDIVVGVRVEGPADLLESRLISDPAMSDAEIMAYLATGRPLATLGKDGTADAMSLAGFLMGPSTASQHIKDKLQRALGLDSLEVSAGLESGTVAAGKKLGERTTVSLEETIAAETTTAVTIEYLLRKNITIFARQVQNTAPTLGLRLRKEWGGPSR